MCSYTEADSSNVINLPIEHVVVTAMPGDKDKDTERLPTAQIAGLVRVRGN